MAAKMPICGDLLVALIALAVVGHVGQAESSSDVGTDSPGTTTETHTSPPPSTVMYLPRPHVQEPADPCKAGNYVSSAFVANDGSHSTL